MIIGRSKLAKISEKSFDTDQRSESKKKKKERNKETSRDNDVMSWCIDEYRQKQSLVTFLTIDCMLMPVFRMNF